MPLIDTINRQLALAHHLDLDLNPDEDLDQIEPNTYHEHLFRYGDQEYLVLTDAEADDRAADAIKESAWAFNSWFLASYTDLPEKVFKALSEDCESSNDAIVALIERSSGGMEGFIEQAISADGRGHFLANYDSEEHEEGDYFIYRVN